MRSLGCSERQAGQPRRGRTQVRGSGPEAPLGAQSPPPAAECAYHGGPAASPSPDRVGQWQDSLLLHFLPHWAFSLGRYAPGQLCDAHAGPAAGLFPPGITQALQPQLTGLAGLREVACVCGMVPS